MDSGGERCMARSRFLGMALIVGVLLAGCMPPKTKEVGEAVRAAMDRQIANPKAGTQPDPSSRLEGPAGALLMERYYLGGSMNAPPAQMAPSPSFRAGSSETTR